MCFVRVASSRRPSTRWSISFVSFASEVTRVAREVGTDSRRPGHRAGVAAPGSDLTDLVNAMCGNLTDQVGATSPMSRPPWRGAPLQDHRRRAGEPELKDTINTMVDQLTAFASEVMTWRAKSAPTSLAAGHRAGCRRHLEDLTEG